LHIIALKLRKKKKLLKKFQSKSQQRLKKRRIP
jgi:hypothetical protein